MCWEKNIFPSSSSIVQFSDDKKQQFTILQKDLNAIKNYEYDFTKTKRLSEINKNTPVKLINTMYMNYGCNNPDTPCFIYSINDNRFCKSINWSHIFL